MTAAVGFPTLRLVRTSIEGIYLDEMMPEDVKEFNSTEFYELLQLK